MAELLASPGAEGTLDVGDLCRMFEESEDATFTARKDAERDRDYVDNKQLTSKELSALEKRGQPPVIDNRIKTKVDYLVGLEKQQRVKPKAFPRTPKHETDADGATEALRYVSEEQDYESKRSGVWRNMLVEGAGGIGVSVEQAVDYGGRPGIDIKLRKVAWDRMFWDPHSSEADFSDAGYLGVVTWMDYDDALAMYQDNPDAADILDTTLSSSPSDTYDDKPKFSHWADKKRKRIRICGIWIKRAEQFYFAEYTKGGILKSGPSPYVTDKGESDDELVFQSAYVDRDNNRYGLVREMITLQDEINKRRSKGVHLLNVNQVFYEDGAIDNIELFRREAARPDGTMKLAPGSLKDNRFKIERGIDLAAAHFQLLQEAKNSIDLKGPNATEMGDKTQGSNSASGRAIIASQQGGMIQIGDLMDGLRHLDKRVFRKIWWRIRQFWDQEKWIRVTDDEQNVKWLGLNISPEQMQQLQMAAQQNPAAMEKIAGVIGSVAELDCDIIIDDAPDSLTPQIEQFQSLVELKKFDSHNEIPFRAIVSAMPNLKDKQSFLKAIDEQNEQRQGQPSPEVAKAQAQMDLEKQKAASQEQLQARKIEADAIAAERKSQRDAELARQKAAEDAELARQKAVAELQLKRDIAAAEAEIERDKADRSMAIEGARAKASMDNDWQKHELSQKIRHRESVLSDDDSLEVEVESKGDKIADAIEAMSKGMVQMAESIEEMGEKIASPKKIIRDKSGNIIGSEPVNRVA